MWPESRGMGVIMKGRKEEIKGNVWGETLPNAETILS